MENLYQIWLRNKNNQDLRLRYCDWNHRVKYVRIIGESADRKGLRGILASGEEVTLSKQSEFWHVYHEGDEHQACAI